MQQYFVLTIINSSNTQSTIGIYTYALEKQYSNTTYTRQSTVQTNIHVAPAKYTKCRSAQYHLRGMPIQCLDTYVVYMETVRTSHSHIAFTLLLSNEALRNNTCPYSAPCFRSRFFSMPSFTTYYQPAVIAASPPCHSPLLLSTQYGTRRCGHRAAATGTYPPSYPATAAPRCSR